MKNNIAEIKELDLLLNGDTHAFKSEVKTFNSSFMEDVRFLNHREWLLKSALLRGYITETVAPGGVGKSAMQLGMALSVALGQDLIGLEVHEQVNVLVVNNEDDNDEIVRRVAGFCTFHNIDPSRLDGRLFVYSGYGHPLKIATEDPDGNVIPSPDLELLKEFISEHKIKALLIDPRISTHNSNENDNNKLDKVANVYKALARETGVAINIAHHTRKTGSDNLGYGSEIIAGDAEAGRGASAFKDAARGILTLARMSHKTAENLGIEESQQGRYFRMDHAKQNQEVMDKRATWYYMESVMIPNCEAVGVPVRKNMDPLFEQAAAKDGRVKWSPQIVAESIHKLMPESEDAMLWADLRERFCTENDISQSKANEKPKLLSMHKDDPTRISVEGAYFDFWYTKQGGRTGPITVHRRAL